MARQVFRFEVAGDVQYSRAFDALAEEVRDLTEPLTAVGELVVRDVGEQFRSEGAFGHGSKWTPLNTDYERWKEQQVGVEPILVFSGKMREAMMARSAVHVSPRRMEYDPDAPDYAIRHQQGDEERGLPQRKMVEIPGSERRAVDRIFATWLNSIRRERLAGLRI
jgi:hypothetical protein